MAASPAPRRNGGPAARFDAASVVARAVRTAPRPLPGCPCRAAARSRSWRWRGCAGRSVSRRRMGLANGRGSTRFSCACRVRCCSLPCRRSSAWPRSCSRCLPPRGASRASAARGRLAASGSTDECRGTVPTRKSPSASPDRHGPDSSPGSAGCPAVVALSPPCPIARTSPVVRAIGQRGATDSASVRAARVRASHRRRAIGRPGTRAGLGAMPLREPPVPGLVRSPGQAVARGGCGACHDRRAAVPPRRRG
jgi:hypothetical protein